MADPVNVVHIHGGFVSIPGRANEDAIARAKWLLEACESGEINGFAAVYHFSDTATGYTRAGVVSYSTIGQIERVKRKMLDDLEG